MENFEDIKKEFFKLLCECNDIKNETDSNINLNLKDILCDCENKSSFTIENPTPIKLESEEINNSIENIDKSNLDEVFNSLNSNEYFLIKSNINGVVLNVFKNINDSIKINENILKIKTNESEINVPFFKDGEIISIYKNKNDFININDDLFLIKIKNKDGFLNKLKNEIKKTINDSELLIKYKLELPELEKNYYYNEIIYTFYKNRFEAYSYYFKRFDTILKTIEDKNNQLNEIKNKINEIENKINEIFGNDNSANINEINKLELIEYIKTRNDLIETANQLVIDINNNVGVLNAIRNEQNFFAVKSEQTLANIEAQITDTTFLENNLNTILKNPLNENSTQIQTFSENVEEFEITPAHILAQNLYAVISKFSNQISINGKSIFNLNEISVPNYDIKFKIQNLENNLVIYDGNTLLDFNGFYYIKKKELIDFILSIEKNELSDSINDIKNKEVQTAFDIENNLTYTLSKMEMPSKDFGYALININKVYFKVQNSDVFNTLEKEFKDQEQKRNELKSKLEFIRSEIKRIETELNNLENKINNLNDKFKTSGQIKTKEGFDANLVYFPYIENKNENEQNLINEDINFRDNPNDLNISPPITDIRWWKKFCNLASTFNLNPIYWPIGLIIPTPTGPINIPFPIFWKPIAVINTPLFLMAIGISQCGVVTGPWVFLLNPNDFNLGNITPKSCWFIGAIRPIVLIKNNPGSEVFKEQLKFGQIGLNKIDLDPDLSKQIPFKKDDLPPYERLSLNNIIFLNFLNDWCRAGKLSQGFF